ncbi:hypothetical protein [Haloferula sp.]|uniref:hypothetical protein n=1 Tax=Haloferula sp. TaxID=2497595 RepID=UPI00329FBC23
MSLFSNWKDNRAIAKWEAAGCPAPPPHAIKQKNIRDYRERFGLDVLVETGTFKGDMIQAMRGDFRKLYSIELADHFHEAAVERFQSDPSIEILHGDSGKVMSELVPKLDGPALFWLDGHYSAGNTARGDKDTPVMEELGHIFAREDLRCVILIDDARCFEGKSEQIYPSMDEVRAFVASHRPDWKVEVDTDCIRISPPA